MSQEKSEKYHFKSKNTNFYISSTKDDKPGQVVTTKDGKDSVPSDTVLTVAPSLTETPVIVTITGVTGLYVSLQSITENTKLTWSDKKYEWLINKTATGVYYITANGPDLYWIDVFGIGPVVEVRPGASIVPPQNEWILTKA